jgi:DNA-binding NarL/FixJ family response regulator
VVDDQELIREGIASLLGLQEGIEVVGTAADGLLALEAAADLNPDVVLMVPQP